MTPQEHLARAEMLLVKAERYNADHARHKYADLAVAHAQIGMLAQAVQESESMGQINATAQAVRVELLKRAQER